MDLVLRLFFKDGFWCQMWGFPWSFSGLPLTSAWWPLTSSQADDDQVVVFNQSLVHLLSRISYLGHVMAFKPDPFTKWTPWDRVESWKYHLSFFPKCDEIKALLLDANLDCFMLQWQLVSQKRFNYNHWRVQCFRKEKKYLKRKWNGYLYIRDSF